MLNILVNAYAVSPNWGSEPGLGWNWIINLAKNCNVFAITEGEWKEEIETAVSKLPQKDNIHFFYSTVPSKVRKICWDQGDWRFYKYYREWQENALSIAKMIIDTYPIDVIHQLNMIGFREPGSLWKIKDTPFVWGPVGGYGWSTMKYLNGQPLSVRLKILCKNLINHVQGKYYPLSNNAMRRADCILAANSDVYSFIKKNLRQDVILMNETGCYAMECSPNIIQKKTTFDILWVGKFDYRKQLDLAIRTVAIINEKYDNVRLHIVGDTNHTDFARLENLAIKLGIDKRIIWHGKIPNSCVHEMMRISDLFLFTSIDEGTPHVVLEAIQNSLPIVCFDTCGQGDIVNDRVGIKIPLSDYKKSPETFANAIEKLMDNRDLLNSMRAACRDRQEEVSWDSKMKRMIEIYYKVLSSNK